MIDWPQVTKDVSAQLGSLRADAPEVMKAFSSLAKRRRSAKRPMLKKELIALGIAVAVRCDDCIAFHVKAALERSHQRRGDRDARYGNPYGAGPAVMYAPHVVEAYSQFTKAAQRDRFGLEPAALSSRSLEALVRFGEKFLSPRAHNLGCQRAAIGC